MTTLRFEGAETDGARRTFRFVSYVQPDFIDRALLVTFEDGRIAELYFSSNEHGTARWTERSGLVDSHRWESDDEARSGSYLARRYPIILENGPVSGEYALRATVPDVLDALADRELAGFLMTLVSGFRIGDADEFEERQRRLDEEQDGAAYRHPEAGEPLQPVTLTTARDHGAVDAVTRPTSVTREKTAAAGPAADAVTSQERPARPSRSEEANGDAGGRERAPGATRSGPAGRVSGIDRVREFFAAIREYFAPAPPENERPSGTDSGSARERMDGVARIARRIKRR